MLTAEQIITQARALSPAPIGRGNYIAIAERIHPRTALPTLTVAQAESTAALPEFAAWRAFTPSHTHDWADMVAEVVLIWQLSAARQRWLDTHQQEQSHAPENL